MEPTTDTQPTEDTQRTKPVMTVVLAEPRGFCAGVERAIDVVERSLERFGAPIYVRHEIVHNKHVVDDLRAKGVIFVKEVDEVPVGAVAIFSAHGVAERVEEAAGERGLKAIDATCPLVTKVHREGRRYAEEGYDVVMIGHLGHPEVEGTLGRIPGKVQVISEPEDVAGLEVKDPERVAFVTQTTLSVNDTRDVIEALKTKFPAIVGPDVRDICYATQNRQTAVAEMAKHVDMILVVGAKNSSNSNRLRELGETIGIPSYLIADADAMENGWIEGKTRIGLTAGASAPETLVQGVIERLRASYEVEVKSLNVIRENVTFKLPRELLDDAEPSRAAGA
ncbi:4-hydroxy-3-methylbut-2-enyl diphosphate reductase [Candidatus Phaeomarinobacter ectocarpi]|uniref:4-hydroxy-3-methylbut-2-enyl diphosphate reductase n=1 Tax=Candidatus Phaeomarinibacter ectocarpi TaxID=1458461 RepID=X5M5Z3_9HYPH|nr:4-hydroxy-3-methylbut-2-enyl diphosphate reductase [Candidatus Phaeomarinobacter ectocarpi]